MACLSVIWDKVGPPLGTLVDTTEGDSYDALSNAEPALSSIRQKVC